MKGLLFNLIGLALPGSGQALQHYGVPEGLVLPRDTTTTVPAPLKLSPSQYWDGNDGPWTSYILRLGGSRSQEVRVFPSTKANSIWAVHDAKSCPGGYFPGNNSVEDCKHNRGGTFNEDASGEWLDQSVYELHIDEDLGYNEVRSSYGFDKVGLDYLGAGGTLSHQMIATIADPLFWFGVLPLNPRGINFTDSNNPQKSLLQALKDAKNISSLSWGYTAGAKYRSENFFGSLVLGGFDPARFDNASQISVPFNGDTEKDLTIRVNNISTSSSSSSQDLTTESANFVIDSTVPYLYLPESSCTMFEEEFGLERNNKSGLYLVNNTHYSALVEQRAKITFNVGTTDTTKIVFPIEAFLLTATFPLVSGDSTSYYFPIKQANKTSQYTLGRAFLQEAYIVYDYERSKFTLAPCIWPTDTADTPPSSPIAIYSTDPAGNSTISNSDNRDTHSLSAGAIAGAVVGGIIAGLVLAWLVWFRHRRRQQRLHNAQTTTTPFPFPFFKPAHTRSSSSTTMPTSPGGSRPRAGSRLATFFRNPWGSMSSASGVPGSGAPLYDSNSNNNGNNMGPDGQPMVYELADDPLAPTPAQREAAARKRHLSSELDAEVCAVHEMFDERDVARLRAEAPGDGPLPTYDTGDGGTIEGNVLRAQHEAERRERDDAAAAGARSPGIGYEERRRLSQRARRGVYEMDATATSSARPPRSSVPSTPPMPSPGQLDAVARKELEERERREAERAEAERARARGELERRTSGRADTVSSAEGTLSPPLPPSAAAVDRPETERRVSDLSPISENSGFVVGRSTSFSAPDAGSRRVSRD